jgi:hypothetical protein
MCFLELFLGHSRLAPLAGAVEADKITKKCVTRTSFVSLSGSDLRDLRGPLL